MATLTSGRAAAAASIAATAALAAACVLAVSARLFSVVKYESVIHEFDPYFNYRECGGIGVGVWRCEGEGEGAAVCFLVARDPSDQCQSWGAGAVCAPSRTRCCWPRPCPRSQGITEA